MQVEFKENVLLLIPQNPHEKEAMVKLFPLECHLQSKRVKAKQFVDKYGFTTGDHYLEIKGFSKKEKQ
jgi:hypothetical protein